MALLFRIKDLAQRTVVHREFENDTVLIGRGRDCDLVLPQKKVSTHHAEVSSRNGVVHVMDLRSREGVFLNGERIDSRRILTPRDGVTIGDFKIRVALRAGRAQSQASAVQERGASRSASARSRPATARRRARPSIDPFEDLEDDAIAKPVEDPVQETLDDPVLEAPEPEAEPDEEQADSIWSDNSEYGYLLEFLSPIKEYLLDPDVSEIMVNGPEQVYIEKGGRLITTPAMFPSDTALVSVVQNIAQSVGRGIDAKNPILDARLPDGSRVNAVIRPCARRGTYIAIRKFMSGRLTIEKLLEYGALSRAGADFIRACVLASLNVIVTGGTGSGKTTLLNIVSDYIPESERIIVIEDASELQLQQTHLLPMETRQADPKTGRGRISIRDLLRTSLRLRPDRLVIGELRGEEAFDLLQAFNTGHRGSMTTIHSNSPRDCLSRLEMLVTLAGLDVPLRAIREQIASAVDIVIYTSRLHDGSRRITHISEVLPLNEAGNYEVQDIFRMRREGTAEDGRLLGRLDATGKVPVLMEHFENEAITFPQGFFRSAAGPG